MLRGQSNAGRRGGHRKTSEVPMKVRRRQSDARWRANVASCYETLKHVIPINIRASKRQISKAFILQETARHINFLEDLLMQLLQEKERQNSNNEPCVDLCRQQLSSIDHDFVEEQVMKSEHPPQERKYKRQKPKPVVPEAPLKTQCEDILKNAEPPKTIIPKKSNRGRKLKRKIETSAVQEAQGAQMPKKTKVVKVKAKSEKAVPKKTVAAAAVMEDQLPPSPQFSESEECIVPVMTPSKQANSTSGSFTPVKLPTNWDTPLRPSFLDTPMSQRTESAWESDDNFESQDLRCSERMWMSDDDDEQDQSLANEHTPRPTDKQFDISVYVKKRGRSRYLSECSDACVPVLDKDKNAVHRNGELSPRCRRSLQQALDLPEFDDAGVFGLDPDLCCSESCSPIDPVLHPTDQDKLSLPTQAPCVSTSGFAGDASAKDGYQLFYQHKLSEIDTAESGDNQQSVSSVIYKLWEGMDEAQKKSFVDLAIAEAGDSSTTFSNTSRISDLSLSEDLQEIDLSPIEDSVSNSDFAIRENILGSNVNEFDSFFGDYKTTQATEESDKLMGPVFTLPDYPRENPEQVVPEDAPGAAKVFVVRMPTTNTLTFTNVWRISGNELLQEPQN